MVGVWKGVCEGVGEVGVRSVAGCVKQNMINKKNIIFNKFINW